jgi:predicted solute-binding protein
MGVKGKIEVHDNNDDGSSAAAAATLESSMTTHELLELMLDQLKIMNIHLGILTDSVFEIEELD